MPFLTIQVDTGSQDTVAQANQRLVNDSTKPLEGVIALRNQLEALLAGTLDGSVSIAVHGSSVPPVADSGGISATYNLK